MIQQDVLRVFKNILWKFLVFISHVDNFSNHNLGFGFVFWLLFLGQGEYGGQ